MKRQPYRGKVYRASLPGTNIEWFGLASSDKDVRMRYGPDWRIEHVNEDGVKRLVQKSRWSGPTIPRIPALR